MATITLTDRISVRVTAKDSTETSNQNKTNGGNVASALGGSGLTDSEKEELGESLGETVTDEDGRTYARSDKVAGVLKQIAAAGKLSEPTTEYDGITENGIVYKLNPVYSGGYIAKRYWDENNTKLNTERNYSSNALFVITGGRSVFFSKESFVVNNEQTLYPNSMYNDPPSGEPTVNNYKNDSKATNVTINGVRYSFFIINDRFETTYGHGGGNVYTIDASYKTEEHGYAGDSTNFLKCVAGTLFGPTHKSGGAKIDPTEKTDAQIQKDLEDFAALNNCKMTSKSGDSYIAVTDANGNPLYFLGT